MTHDPYDIDNRTTAGANPPEDPYIRSRTGYGNGSGLAFVIFGVVAVLLIGFAVFGGYSDNNRVSKPQTTAQQEVQPAQPQPAPAAPSTTTGSTNQ